jgi:hypothetical protein
VTEAGLGTGGVDGWDDAGVAGELSGGGEAIDRADLPFDDDGQDVRHTREGFEQLDGGGEGDSLPNAIFELSDLLLEAVEGLEFLGDTAAGLRGKPRQGAFEPPLPAPTKRSLCSVVLTPYSLAPPARAGVASEAWMRFFKAVRSLERAIRVR